MKPQNELEHLFSWLSAVVNQLTAQAIHKIGLSSMVLAHLTVNLVLR